MAEHGHGRAGYLQCFNLGGDYTDKVEVDLIIENAAGQMVDVEVKAAATVRENDLRGLRKRSKLAGDQFKMGILFYDGDEAEPLGDNIGAAPLSRMRGGDSTLRVGHTFFCAEACLVDLDGGRTIIRIPPYCPAELPRSLEREFEIECRLNHQ